MKTNIQVKDEPVELQNYTNETVNELLRLYGYNLPGQLTSKPFKLTSPRTKSTAHPEQEPSTCAWCQKLGVRSFTLRTDTGDSKTLCSEVCFNQYRRASFKKNKDYSVMDESSTSFVPAKLERTIVSKIKPMCVSVSEKRSKPTNELAISAVQHSSTDSNRRKLLLPLRRPTPTKTTTELTAKRSPSPPSKRHRLSSPTESSLPVESSPTPTSNRPLNLTWPSPFLLSTTLPWSSASDINRFQYPFYTAPPPPPPPAPLAPASLPTASSSLFTTLLKGTSSSITCILPTFIPLPIPIPIPLFSSAHLPCKKCSTEVTDQQSQTEDTLSSKATRRMSV